MLISLLFRIVSSLYHIHLPLFMINKVNVTLLRQFLGFYRCNMVIHDVFLISWLFRICQSLNHINLHLFMIDKVNVSILRLFLGLYCLFYLIIIMVKSRYFLISLFRIASSLNHIHLPLFMLNKVNVTLLRQFLGLHCLSKFIIWLNHDFFYSHDYLGFVKAWITFIYICSF